MIGGGRVESVRVSIITASFNDLEGLMATADSISRQNYPIEWVVIDADSGPPVRKYLSNYKSDSINLIWVSEKDKGLYDGMNKGFQRSSGDIILFLNTGDLLSEEDAIAKVIGSYKDRNWSWCVGLAVRLRSSGTPYSVWEYLEPQLGGLALGTRTFCHQACFYGRNILEQVMPYEIGNLAADHLLNIRAFRISSPFMLPLITTFFQDGGVSSQRNFRTAMKDLARIRKEEKLYLLNSRLADLILSEVIVFLVNFGGLIWRFLRMASRKLIQEDIRFGDVKTSTKS